jgi:hypothetical protein
MPVVRISLGRFDAANYETIRKLLDDSKETLIPAIRALKGNRAYYVGIDSENNAMTNVSVWDTRIDAEQMAALQPVLPRFSSMLGCVSKDLLPTTKYSGRCDIVWPAIVIDHGQRGTREHGERYA